MYSLTLLQIAHLRKKTKKRRIRERARRDATEINNVIKEKEGLIREREGTIGLAHGAPQVHGLRG